MKIVIRLGLILVFVFWFSSISAQKQDRLSFSSFGALRCTCSFEYNKGLRLVVKSPTMPINVIKNINGQAIGISMDYLVSRPFDLVFRLSPIIKYEHYKRDFVFNKSQTKSINRFMNDFDFSLIKKFHTGSIFFYFGYSYTVFNFGQTIKYDESITLITREFDLQYSTNSILLGYEKKAWFAELALHFANRDLYESNQTSKFLNSKIGRRLFDF